ncbi:MAG: hypothetical protein AB7G15_13515 [Alphaproteobacteria bacterium]
MNKRTPKQMLSRRVAIQEKREQMADLSALHQELSAQLHRLDTAAPAGEDFTERRQRLNASVAQVETQLEQAKQALAEQQRVVLVMETLAANRRPNDRLRVRRAS